MNLLCVELEDQVRQLEALIEQRIQSARPRAAPPSEAAEEVRAISPESSSPKVPTPAPSTATSIETVEAEPGASPEPEPSARSEAGTPGTYIMMTPTLADIYASQGLIKEATSVLEKILQQEPEREDVRRRLEHLKLKLSESESEHRHDRTHTEA